MTKEKYKINSSMADKAKFIETDQSFAQLLLIKPLIMRLSLIIQPMRAYSIHCATDNVAYTSTSASSAERIIEGVYVCAREAALNKCAL